MDPNFSAHPGVRKRFLNPKETPPNFLKPNNDSNVILPPHLQKPLEITVVNELYHPVQIFVNYSDHIAKIRNDYSTKFNINKKLLRFYKEGKEIEMRGRVFETLSDCDIIEAVLLVDKTQEKEKQLEKENEELSKRVKTLEIETNKLRKVITFTLSETEQRFSEQKKEIDLLKKILLSVINHKSGNGENLTEEMKKYIEIHSKNE